MTYLVRVGETTHTAHDPQHVVVGGVHPDVGHTASPNGVRGHNHLDRGVVDPREVAGARRLMLLRAEGERVHVDTSGRGGGVVLERLNQVEVRTEALREAVLAVEEELGANNWVAAPAVLRPRALGDDRGNGPGRTAVESRAVGKTAAIAVSTTLGGVCFIGIRKAPSEAVPGCPPVLLSWGDLGVDLKATTAVLTARLFRIVRDAVALEPGRGGLAQAAVRADAAGLAEATSYEGAAVVARVAEVETVVQ